MYKNILHATDLAENHFNMCKKAQEIAGAFHANLYIMHVIEQPASLQVAQGLGFTEIQNPTASAENAESILKMIGESLSIKSSNLFVKIGSIKENVLQKAEELDCGLIVLGKHNSHLLMPEFLENSAHNIEESAVCDILTLK